MVGMTSSGRRTGLGSGVWPRSSITSTSRVTRSAPTRASWTPTGQLSTRTCAWGALGYGMSVQNPIRVAEETAILDYLSGGRTFVGFARGYQSRWTNILGQHLGPKATLSPSGSPEEKMAALTEEQRATRFADDQNNREVFEEQVDLVLRAWAEDSIDSKGRWEIPYPYKRGHRLDDDGYQGDRCSRRVGRRPVYG